MTRAIDCPAQAAAGTRPVVQSRTLSYGRMQKPRQVRQSFNRLTSAAMVVIGIALLIRTIAAGGGALASGIVLGVLFIAAGVGRIYLQWRGH